MTWKGVARFYLILVGINLPSPLFLWFILQLLDYRIGLLMCVLIVLALVVVAMVTAYFLRTLPIWFSDDEGWVSIEKGIPEIGKTVIVSYDDKRTVMVRHHDGWYEALTFSGAFTLPKTAVWQYLPPAPDKKA